MPATELGGGEKPKLVTVTESVPLPTDRKELVSLFQKILDLGKVQKVVVEVGHPIVFKRKVPEDEVAETQSVEDPLDAVRTGDIVEPDTGSLQPHEVVLSSYKMLDQKGAVPAFLVVGPETTLRQWLNLTGTTFFGLPILTSPSLDEGTAILAGVDPEDPESMKLSIRFVMEGIKKEKK